MALSFIKVSYALIALLTGVSAQLRVQGGVCGDNGLDGITGSVPACMFFAGSTYNGQSFPYQLAIGSGITSCDQCTNGTIYGLYLCTLYECESDFPYEPCGYAAC